MSKRRRDETRKLNGFCCYTSLAFVLGYYAEAKKESYSNIIFFFLCCPFFGEFKI